MPKIQKIYNIQKIQNTKANYWLLSGTKRLQIRVRKTANCKIYRKKTNGNEKHIHIAKCKLLTIEWHKEAADQSSENCKLQKRYRKNERKYKTTTITKCKMQTLAHWVAQRGCRSEFTNCKKQENTENTTNTKCKM